MFLLSLLMVFVNFFTACCAGYWLERVSELHRYLWNGRPVSKWRHLYHDRQWACVRLSQHRIRRNFLRKRWVSEVYIRFYKRWFIVEGFSPPPRISPTLLNPAFFSLAAFFFQSFLFRGECESEVFRVSEREGEFAEDDWRVPWEQGRNIVTSND